MTRIARVMLIGHIQNEVKLKQIFCLPISANAIVAWRVLPADCCSSRVCSSPWIGWVHVLKGCISYWKKTGADGGGLKIDRLTWIQMCLLLWMHLWNVRPEIKNGLREWTRNKNHFILFMVHAELAYQYLRIFQGRRDSPAVCIN